MQNPFVRGLLSAQQAADARTMGQIQQMGGLLSLQNQMHEAPIRQKMLELQFQKMQGGPEPKWQVTERFTPDGRKEKVIVDLNNPSNVLPFGGSEARALSFQNTGDGTQGVDPFTGVPVGPKLTLAVSPNTQATLAQGDQHFNRMFPIHANNAGVNAANLYYNTGMGPSPVPGVGFSPAQIQAAGPAPTPAPTPVPPSRTPTPANFPRVSPQEQAQRDAESRRIQVAEQNGGQGMIPSSAVLPPRLRDEAAAKALEPQKPTAESLKQTTGVQNLKQAIATYREDLNKLGSFDVVNPASRARLGTTYNNMMLQAKEAYNLGVLNGPDYAILQEVITNPMTLTGAITPKAALQDQLTKLEEIMGKVGQTVQDVQANRGGQRQVYVQPGTPLRRSSDMPSVGTVVDGWRFNGGDPSKRENWSK